MTRWRTTLFAVLLLACSNAHAELKLANVFTDHMVLQQQMPIRVWGWATPGKEIEVSLAGDSKNVTGQATAAADGKWFVEMKALEADGKPMTLSVEGDGGKVDLKDVLMGEVWICSGQSNMEWSVKASGDAKKEIAAADFPMIRMFDVPQHLELDTPQADAQKSKWLVCSPKTVENFSAVGYYFGRELNRELNVPIGLVGSNWGGRKIEPFTPPEGFLAVPQLADMNAAIKKMDPTTPEGKAAREAYVNQVDAWLAAAKQTLAKGGAISTAPALSLAPPAGATRIYNGMVAGLAPLSMRGAIWYQGESNAGDGLKYDFLKEALVKGWRSVFKNDDLSFYWVQLANFQQPSDDPAGGGWGPVREGQRRALRLPKTGMAVIIDIGTAGNIHPPNKQDVGKRLALWALAKDYGKTLVYSGPLYKSHAVDGNKVRLSFDHVGSGLMVGRKPGTAPTEEVKDGELAEFSVRDKDGKWHWAKATIDKNDVIVWSESVSEPTAVRYAYQSNPAKANLYNKEGLPASPFTTVD
jgi:sialate O-acetylesterase